MPGEIKVALIGDYNPSVKAHVAIPKALEFAGNAAGCNVQYTWIATPLLESRVEEQLSEYHAIWCTPASPYDSMGGALNAIRFAREHDRPFLGTCGGFQHALIEYARNVLGLGDADHAESSPDAPTLLVTPLTCGLRESKGQIRLKDGSKARAIYGQSEIEEEYNCSYGLNPAYEELFNNSTLNVTGVDADGEVRVIELTDHPFFIATLFQPERSALAGRAHPLINAYVRASASLPVESGGVAFLSR